MGFTRTGRTSPSLSEINVTPLVDVVLVLLIIFMITAPIMQTGITVDLPTMRTAVSVNPEQRVVISIAGDETLYYGSEPIRFDRIAARLRRDVGDSKEPIYLRADKDVRWKTVVAVLEKIKDAKYQNVQIVTRVFSPKK